MTFNIIQEKKGRVNIFWFYQSYKPYIKKPTDVVNKTVLDHW